MWLLTGSNVRFHLTTLMCLTEYAKVSYLDSYKTEVVSNVGDAQRRMLIVDYALTVTNPAAHGIYADVDDDTAMTA